jgi:hypothetical protein
MWFHSPVDNHTVAVQQSSILHRVTLYIAIERRFRVTDIVTVEVQRLMLIVVSRTGKSCCDSSMFQFQLSVEHTSNYLDVPSRLFMLGINLDVPHLKIVIILVLFCKDNNYSAFLAIFATKVLF